MFWLRVRKEQECQQLRQLPFYLVDSQARELDAGVQVSGADRWVKLLNGQRDVDLLSDPGPEEEPAHVGDVLRRAPCRRESKTSSAASTRPGVSAWTRRRSGTHRRPPGGGTRPLARRLNGAPRGAVSTARNAESCAAARAELELPPAPTPSTRQGCCCTRLAQKVPLMPDNQPDARHPLHCRRCCAPARPASGGPGSSTLSLRSGLRG